MGYKMIRIKEHTDELIDQCIRDYLRHHPEMREIPISRNKIIHEIANFYLKM